MPKTAKRGTRKKTISRSPTSLGLGPSPAELAQIEAEDDLRVLRRADEIKNDKTRLQRAKRLAKKESDILRRLV